MHAPIDVQRVRDVLTYDPLTGVVTRKGDTLTRRNNGAPVGQITKKGYLQAKVDGKSYLVHRLAYALHHGVDPGAQMVDHIDGDRANNLITNLRLCNNSENLMNRRGVPSHSTTGLRGVHFSKKECKFVAHLKVAGKMRRLGAFANAEDAAHEAAQARRHFYGGFHGADA